MANYNINCPHCGGTLEVQSDWEGLEVTCPLCNNAFTIPRREIPAAATGRRATPPPPPPPPAQSLPVGRYTPAADGGSRSSAAESSGGSSKGLGILVKIVVFILFAAGGAFWAFKSDELAADKVARDVETKEMAKLFNNSNFIYHGASVRGVKLTKDKERERTYTGEVMFGRNSRTFRRPISVTYEKNGKDISYRYGIDFDYSKHPEFMIEDADMFFDRLKGQLELKEWNFVSAGNLSPGVVRCIVRKGTEQGEVDIEIGNKDGKTHYKIVHFQGIPELDFLEGLRCYPKNRAEAVKWYRRAAEKGHAEAQQNLGVCYFNGWGVAKNAAEAVKWFRKAAEKGVAEAQVCLGACYADGIGVKQSDHEAELWFRKAAKQGNKVAQEFLKKAGKTW